MLTGFAESHTVIGRKLPHVSGEVQDVLLWVCVKRSGFVLVAGTIFWLLLGSGVTGLTMEQMAALLVVVVLPVMWAWGVVAPYVGASLCVRDMLLPDVLKHGVTEVDAKQMVTTTLPYVNNGMIFLGNLLSGTDVKLTFVVTACSYLMFKLLGVVNLITMMYIVLLLAMSLPSVYVRKQKECDELIAKAKDAIAKVEQTISKKAHPVAKSE